LWDGQITKIDKVEELNIGWEQWWNKGDKGNSKCLEKHLQFVQFNSYLLYKY